MLSKEDNSCFLIPYRCLSARPRQFTFLFLCWFQLPLKLILNYNFLSPPSKKECFNKHSLIFKSPFQEKLHFSVKNSWPGLQRILPEMLSKTHICASSWGEGTQLPIRFQMNPWKATNHYRLVCSAFDVCTLLFYVTFFR